MVESTSWNANRIYVYERSLIMAQNARLYRKARRRLGLSQEQVAERAGITSVTYGYLERGVDKNGLPPNPTLDTLVRVASTLGLLRPTPRPANEADGSMLP